MEGIEKIIGIIVGIVIMAGLAAWGISQVNSTKETGDQAMTSIKNIGASLEESKYENYIGDKLTGNDVVSAFKSLQKEDICLIVDNGAANAFVYGIPVQVDGGTTGIINSDAEGNFGTAVTGRISNGKGYSGNVTSIKDGLAKITNAAIETRYVNPGATFKGEVIVSETTDAVIGIVFIKQ